MRRPIYFNHKHYRYLDNFYNDIKVARKTKKFLKKAISEGYLFSKEDHHWELLPDCRWCEGYGTVREHPFDTGYTCPDCIGTGKSGWEFNDKGKKLSFEVA
ncbi:hypothetical protein EBB07_28695 [Paenibacillaceae bacterium]|nr:hypothetical protein EBB07_28695 [Paenibacillaceae bacterium]